MTHIDSVYGIVLYSLGISRTQADECSSIFKDSPELLEALDNPSIKAAEKEKVIDCIFDGVMRSFLKVLCANKVISRIFYILDEYRDYTDMKNNICHASLTYVTMPSQTQLDAVKKMLCQTYKMSDAVVSIKYDPSIIGGFILKAGDYEYDRSYKRQIDNIKHELIRG